MATKHKLKMNLLILLALSSIFIYSQQIPIDNITMREGLSSYYVTDITQDKSGFMWFATKHGVSRFNGSKFTLFNKESSAKALNSDEISAIEADTTHNTVWIANRWTGINVFDCVSETFKSYKNNKNDNNSLISNEIYDIHVSSKGDIWIATSLGLELFNSDSNTFTHFNNKTIRNFPNDAVITIAEGINGEIYLGHLSNGFTILNPKTKALRNFKHSSSNKNSIPDNTVNSIQHGFGSTVWLATNSGLSQFDIATGMFKNFRDLKKIHSTIKDRVPHVFQDSKGRVWVGTISDLCYFDASDIEEIFSEEKNVNHMFIKNIYQGISNPTVLTVFEDSFRNIWIGSNGGGASFITHSKLFFNSWTIDKIPGTVNGLNDKEAMTICIDKNDDIWIGTDGGGINVNKNGINSTFYSANTGEVTSISYLSSLKDSNDDLWFGTYQGIDIYKNKENRFVHYKPYLNNSTVFSIIEDNSKNIWIGNSNGIEIYNLDNYQKSFVNTNNSQLPTNDIRALAQDINGNIWIGTVNKGLVIYNPSSKVMLYPKGNTILNNCRINQLYRDSKNQMWAATNEGLFVFPDNRLVNYKTYDAGSGINSSITCSLQEDLDGNIWISTHYGISCLVVNENRIYNYDHTDGALFGTYMTNSSGKSSDGTIYFGSINGVCYFNPKNKAERTEIPPVIFNEFTVHRKSMHEETKDIHLPVLLGEVKLSYDQNIFSVSFNVMDKSLQGKVEYAYRMEGLTDSWTNISDENVVTFRDIPYRKYKLQVKARYKNEVWKEKYSTLLINVQPPFWLSWWAKTLYVISILLLAYFMILSYKRRLKFKNSLTLEKERAEKELEMNEERLRFYANITHELKTPLTLMLGPLEDLQNVTGIQNEHVKKISLIHKSTIRLLSLVTQILEFRKTETQNKKLYVVREDIAEKIREITLKYKELNRNNDILVEVHIETTQTEIYFDPEVITMIVDNLLSNAFKFTQKGNITLTLRSLVKNNIDYTEIEILDTGCGISEEDFTHIFERYYNPRKRKNIPGFGIGLALVKNLVELHEGEISVESKPNEGTIFRIRLISQNSYPNANHIVNTNVESVEENTNKPIVLIVEDDNDMREYIADVLKDTFDVTIAGNGESGLELARTSIPDVIISDIMMPVMDGIEFCRQIKNDIATSHIPVILLTAKDGIQDKTEGYTVGANSYITKPFSAALLKSRIANLLDERKKIATLFSSGNTLKRVQLQDCLNKIDNEFIEKFTRLIENNLMDEKINTPEIAQELSMSYSSLYRKVKALTGLSTSEFIRKIRIQKAEQLLLSGKYNVSETANMVGLNSISYFRECFKEEFGVSPSEYIKKIKEG